MTAMSPRYIPCETCERHYPEEKGIEVEWDVMGDPRQSIKVCPACAFADTVLRLATAWREPTS